MTTMQEIDPITDEPVLPNTPEEPATTDFSGLLGDAGVPDETREEVESVHIEEMTFKDLQEQTGFSRDALRAIKRVMLSADGQKMFIAMRGAYEQSDFATPGCESTFPYWRQGQASVVQMLRRIRDAKINALDEQ